ncbi:MAG: 2-amino-4-hydroxy-6-hydroxymethyldihydropteridine diphosphokinase [Pseudomonadota bacterium]|nr:2-amino-4-hydroxy-6-hydroxymethyldihydropteridine diphosphokinase [Pseudomonadota bacterium]
MALVWLGVGANLAPEKDLPAGLAHLRETFSVLAVSPCYRSPAMGFDGPDFINLVVVIETDLGVAELSQVCKQIERDFGRPDDAIKYSSRHLDLDILMVDQRSGNVDGIVLPRDDVKRFAFVVRPLLDLWPEAVCPGTGAPIQSYWPGVSDQPLQPTEIAGVEPQALSTEVTQALAAVSSSALTR